MFHGLQKLERKKIWWLRIKGESRSLFFDQEMPMSFCFFSNHSPSISVDLSEWCIFSSLENAIENLPVLLMENNPAWIPACPTGPTGANFIFAKHFSLVGNSATWEWISRGPTQKNALSSGLGIVRKFAQKFTREGLTIFSKCYVTTIPNIEVFGGFLWSVGFIFKATYGFMKISLVSIGLRPLPSQLRSANLRYELQPLLCLFSTVVTLLSPN